MIYYLKQLVSALVLLHIGKSFAIKISSSLKLALLISPIAFSFEKLAKWTIQNEEYILAVLVAIIIDHASGSIKHAFFDKDFSFKENIFGLLLKVFVVVSGALLFEGINIIIEKQNIITDYLNIVAHLMVFLYPAGSAFANCSVITNGKFPPKSWLDRLNAFQQNLNPKDLTENKNEN